MRVGLIDVDGHNFPNLALMRISTYHKERGDVVEWWLGDMFHYDLVYKSKVFSDAYSADLPDPINADKVIKGGTGYAIALKDGREVWTGGEDLPHEIESCKPDYTIYPEHDFAIAMTTRGCPRGCPWCHVACKEGQKVHKVANVSDFYAGQKHIVVLDPNITACAERFDLYEQYIATGATIDFSQGLDVRLITDKDIEYYNRMKLKNLHLAWDNPTDDLRERFENFAAKYERSPHGNKATVYVLTNYNSTQAQDLYRIYTLRDLGYAPYVMIYNKPKAPRETRLLQRYVNNKLIFKSVERFEDYDPKKG